MNACNLGLLESSINSKEFNDSITNKLGYNNKNSNELINSLKLKLIILKMNIILL